MVENTTPPLASTARLRISSCRAKAWVIASGCSSHLRVELSRSVKRKVTVPVGNEVIASPIRRGKHDTDARTAAHSHGVAAVSHFVHAGARRGAVGEKYDCEWDYQPRLTIRPRLQVMEGIKLGWPPPRFGEYLQWSSGGAELYSSTLSEASTSLERTADEAGQMLRGVGDDPNARLAMSGQFLERLDRGAGEYQQLMSRDRLLGVVLNGEESVDKPDLARRTLAAARDKTDAAHEHMGGLMSLVHQTFGVMTDAATNVVNARAEAAINGCIELAHTNAAELFRGVRRRGLLDDAGLPDDGAATPA
jgi:hypothetical protein